MWIFGKHQSAIIDRLQTEVGGAAFASKMLKGSRPTEESASVAVVDVSELLQPKKKSKKAASKAKASGKRTAVSDTMENAEELMADAALHPQAVLSRRSLDGPDQCCRPRHRHHHHHGNDAHGFVDKNFDSKLFIPSWFGSTSNPT